MVDLQRLIAINGIPFAAGCKATLEIAILTLCQTPIAVENSLRWFRARILFVQYSKLMGTVSVDVLLEPILFLEFRDKADGLVGRTCTELRDDIDQRAFDIFRHPLGVAADINVRAFGQPRPQFAADLAHAVLHIEFLVAVARPR